MNARIAGLYRVLSFKEMQGKMVNGRMSSRGKGDSLPYVREYKRLHQRNIPEHGLKLPFSMNHLPGNN